jgi:hypothetical protein
MRPKELNGRLTLNKSTIANLEMKKVKGGCASGVPESCVYKITYDPNFPCPFSHDTCDTEIIC